MRTYQGDVNTTASQSHFLEEPIEPDGDLDGDNYAFQQMMMMHNRSAAPMNDFSDPMLEKFMRT